MLLEECDILAPCAVGHVINGSNASALKCRVLAEGRMVRRLRRPIVFLRKRNDIFVIPDILCNAGGVTVSYFEWVQNLQRFQWTEREVISKLETKLQAAFEQVTSFSKRT